MSAVRVDRGRPRCAGQERAPPAGWAAAGRGLVFRVEWWFQAGTRIGGSSGSPSSFPSSSWSWLVLRA